MGNLKDSNYIKISNFLSKEELYLIQSYSKYHALNNPCFDDLSPFSPVLYNDIIFNSLMESKKQLIEDEVGLKLCVNHAHGRIFIHGATLKNIKDTSKIKVIINIDSCGTSWPLWSEKDSIDLNIGEGLIYSENITFYHKHFFDGKYCNFGYLCYKEDKEDNETEKGRN